MELHGIMKAFPKVKRTAVREGKDAPPLKRKSEETSVTGKVFEGTSVFILPAGIGKARCEIFERQIVQNGGLSERCLRPSVTHVVVDDSVDRERALRLLKPDVLPPGGFLVKCSWLSSCIAEKRLLDPEDFSLLSPERHLKQDTQLVDVREEFSMNAAAAQDVKDAVPEDPTTDQASAPLSPSPASLLSQHPGTTDNLREEDGVSQGDLEALIRGSDPKEESPTSSTGEPKPVSEKWVCARSSQSKMDNHNKHITDKLEVLAKAYTHQGDKWRALGYSKAVNALKSYHKPITSYGEACRIPGIGKRMADKIDEIMESGHLRKLDHMGEAVPILELFSNIWGAGAKTAQLWYQQGFRTLEDIRTKANLNHIQKIGLEHYHDLLDRMPREEASAIEKTVREAALAVDPGLLAIACGSYRRGKTTCGDVDVLISHPDGHSHKGVFVKVLQILHQSGFLTDDLVSHEENGEQKKYMGVCRLPGPGHRHRRLDIIVVPYGEFACSLVYFTGSAHFNRSLRALAKTKGMSLSEHSLNREVKRQGSVKVHGGTPVHTAREQDVFRQLGVPFREPHERDW